MKYKFIIVDDEFHARGVVKSLMADHLDFELCGEAATVEEARNLIPRVAPDLILLDIMLGSSTAFELLSQVSIGNADVVFTTSHEDHALHAIKVSALDYLLKPISNEQLTMAIEKFKKFKNRKPAVVQQQLKIAADFGNADVENAQIALPTLDGFNFVYVRDIIRCESDNTYTTFYFTNEKPLIVSRTLKDWELLLASYKFFRVHNSHLISKRHIRRYKRGEGGQVVMVDNSHVDVSRRRKEDFIAFLMAG